MDKLFKTVMAAGFFFAMTMMTAHASPDTDGPDSGRDTAVTAIADHNSSGDAEHAIGEIEKDTEMDLRAEIEREHESEVSESREIEHGEVSGAESQSGETHTGTH